MHTPDALPAAHCNAREAITPYSRAWLLVLGIALVLLTVSSLLGNWWQAQGAASTCQQAVAWKTYALAAHGQGLRAVELSARPTVSTGESPGRVSF